MIISTTNRHNFDTLCTKLCLFYQIAYIAVFHTTLYFNKGYQLELIKPYFLSHRLQILRILCC